MEIWDSQVLICIPNRGEDVDGEEDRIVGGSESRVNEFPFVVALSLNGRTQFCGASLISEKVQYLSANQGQDTGSVSKEPCRVSLVRVQSSPLVRSAFCPMKTDHTRGLTLYPGY